MYCPNCRNQIDDNSKFCPCCGRQFVHIQQPPIMAYNAPAPAPAPVRARKKKHGCLIAFIVVLLISITAGVLFNFLIIKDVDGNNGEISNSIKEIFIAAPTLTTDNILTNIIINVYCNANYELVDISVQIFDNHNQIAKTVLLRGTNYVLGKTYQLSYKPTLSELVFASKFEFKLKNYY